MDLFVKFFSKPFVHADNRVDFLNKAELRALNRLKFFITFISSLLGAIMVPILIYPLIWYNSFFQILNFSFSIQGEKVQISTLEILFGVFLVVIEVYLLSIIHLIAAHRMAAICGYDKFQHARNIGINDKLNRVLSDDDKSLTGKVGFNPYLGINKRLLLFVNLLLVLKAAVSNWVLKFVLRRFVGRYLIKEWIELAGMPVYALWNGIATYRLLNHMQLAFMGEMAIESKLSDWLKTISGKPETQNLFFQAIQQVLMINRKHEVNVNHLIFSIQNLIETRAIEPVKTKDFIIQLSKQSEETKIFIGDVIAFCLILSENIENVHVSATWKKLKDANIIRISYKQIKQARKSFLAGKGI